MDFFRPVNVAQGRYLWVPLLDLSQMSIIYQLLEIHSTVLKKKSTDIGELGEDGD